MKIGDKLTHEGMEVVLVEEEVTSSCVGCVFAPTDCPYSFGQLMCIDDAGIFKNIFETEFKTKEDNQ